MYLRRTCRQMTRLILLRNECPPSLLQRLVMRLHLIACANCTRFEQQARLMEQAVGRWRHYVGDAGNAGDAAPAPGGTPPSPEPPARR